MPIISGGGGGGGGGPAAGTYLPTGFPTGVTLDTTTYTDPVGGVGKLHTLVFPADAVGIALAITGDAFPRVLLMSDGGDGLYLGNGTFDAWAGAAAVKFSGISGGVSSFVLGGSLATNNSDPNVGLEIATGLPIRFPAQVSLGDVVGDPNINYAFGGNVGDLVMRKDPGGPNQTLYRCTVAGNVGSGGIVSATINAGNGGTGYVPLDTFTIDGGVIAATARVDTVGALGVVTGFTLLTPGAVYTGAVGVTTTATSGVGVGLKVDTVTVVWTGIL